MRTAVVGMACRVPGANSSSKLWQNIISKKDLRQEIPHDRFNVNAFYHPNPANKGTMNTKYGYFLDFPIDHFDAEFFGISGKEAQSMDPQQRLLLEVAYEALEDAQISLDEISGTNTAVYCGSLNDDYQSIAMGDPEQYPTHIATGAGRTFLANRISYHFNLRGPSVSIDTACSSSLICFHMGHQSIMSGESDIAIVCGANIIAYPGMPVMMSDMGFFSSDGRCRSFDADGSGYVRGEGICAVVLRRQSHALESRTRIRAIVSATGSGHDGKKNTGVTVPSSEAQEALIRSTYEEADLDPDDTQFIEAHGTGTRAGDPRETRALGAIFGTSTRAHPIYLGSVKSNLGHLESAAGLAGVIKTVLALEKAIIPPQMHFAKPNPDIHFEEWKLAVPTTELEWPPSRTGVRRASCSSYGYGGANAHVVLDSYKPTAHMKINGVSHVNKSGERPYLIPISSHSQSGGELTKQALKAYISEKTGLDLRMLSHTLSSNRSFHRVRSFTVGSSANDIVAELSTPRDAAKWTTARPEKPNIGFVFTGQGAQTFDMGRQLLSCSLLFKLRLEKCDSVLSSLLDGPTWSIVQELNKDKAESRLSKTEFSQPVCTALQLALVDMLRAWGIKPKAVCGHSSGEIAAAYAAGILSFEKAIVIAYYRGVHMGAGPLRGTPGAMMAVGLNETDAAREMEQYSGSLNIAAVNSSSSITVSGDADSIDNLQETLSGRGIFARKLQVEQAFHSHHMRPLAPVYRNALESLPESVRQSEPQLDSCRMFSSVTRKLADPNGMGSLYWVNNMVLPVYFSDALTGILLDEEENNVVDVLIEIGPHPALKAPSTQVIDSLHLDTLYLATLYRGRPAYECLLESAGQLFALGYPVDLSAVNKDVHPVNGSLAPENGSAYLQDIPSYSWNHKSHWNQATRWSRNYLNRQSNHPLLGHLLPSATSKNVTWRKFLRLSELPWLKDHVIDGSVIFPGAGYISCAIEAAVRLKNHPTGISKILLRDIDIKAALNLLEDDDVGVELLTDIRPLTTSPRNFSDDWLEFNISSFDSQEHFTENCHGYICIEYGGASVVKPFEHYPSAQELEGEACTRVSAENFYMHLAATMGMQYGETFQLFTGDILQGSGFCVASSHFQPETYLVQGLPEYTIVPPALLDNVLQAACASSILTLEASGREAIIPEFVKSLEISGLFAETMAKGESSDYSIRSFSVWLDSRTIRHKMLLSESGSDDILIEVNDVQSNLFRASQTKTGPRTLFFKERWEPCFDLLSINGKQCNQSYDAEMLVRLYTFQHPTARIFLVCSNVETVRQIFTALIPESIGRPLVKRLYVKMSDDDASGLQQLCSEYDELLEAGEPTGPCELVAVVGAPMSESYSKHLTDNGVLIADTTSSDSDGFNITSFEHASILRKIRHEQAPKHVTVIVASSRSPQRTEYLLKQLQQNGDIAKVTVLDLLASATQDIPDHDIIVLSALGSSIGVTTAEEFASIRHLLTLEEKNVVFVLGGGLLDAQEPGQSTVAGLLRSARNENVLSRFVTLDVEEEAATELVGMNIIHALDEALEESELAVRNGLVFIRRVEEDNWLNRKLPDGTGNGPSLQALSNQPPVALNIGTVGLLETLHFAPNEDIVGKSIRPNEIEVDVKASALNFRDVAIAMGIIQDWRLGLEFAGVVTKIGTDVDSSTFKLGDRVVAIGELSIANRTRVEIGNCRKIPDDMSFAQAASFLTITMTANYSLVELVRLRPNETVLIHSASGAVGQIAVQIAQSIGAKVFATCSAPKRAFLRQRFGLNDAQIFSSRDDSFRRGVMEATHGRGVDVILNSLSGKLLEATWQCIANFGRFVEIGKRDIHENASLPMEVFKRNVSFSSVDMQLIKRENPQLYRREIDAACRRVFQEGLDLPELLEVPFGDVEKAFRFLQSGKHIGKIVLVPTRDDKVLVAPASYNMDPLFRPDKTYLLVGGLGGLGSILAEWMFLRGARHFAFHTLSGIVKESAKSGIEWLESRGCGISIYQGDVAAPTDVSKVVDAIGDSLAGVFHLATVLAVVPLRAMSYDQWDAALQPKCDGTWNLHHATIGRHLDFFICFSSIAAVIGQAGQANYCAANCYQDGLMKWRRKQGLVGCSINIGAVLRVGLAAESGVTFDENITPAELTYLVEEAILSERHFALEKQPSFLCKPLITGLNIRTAEKIASNSALRNILANRDGRTTTVGTSKSLTRLLASTPEESDRVALLLDAFAAKTSAVLGVSASSIDHSNPLVAYGLDSIVAIELRKWLKDTTGVDLPLFEILSTKPIKVLLQKVVSEMVVTVPGLDKDNSMVHAKTQSDGIQHAATTSDQRIGQHIEHSDGLVATRISTFQARYYNLHELLEEKWRLNIPTVMRFAADSPEEPAAKCFALLTQHYPILSAAFVKVGQFVEQRTVPQSRHSFAVVDLSEYENASEKLEQLKDSYTRTELDIEHGQTWMARLARMPGGEYILVSVFHHLVTDGYGGKLLIAHWLKLFDAIVSGRPTASIPIPRINYFDFTVWHNAFLESDGMAEHRDFWRSYLEGIPTNSTLLPFSKRPTRPLTFNSDRGTCSTMISPNYVKRMKRICQQLNATPFHFIVAALRSYIFRYTAERDIVICMMEMIRPHVDVEDVPGCFSNVIPLRFNSAELSGGLFADLVKTTAENCITAISHKMLPYQEIAKLVDTDTKPGCMPLGQVAINYDMDDPESGLRAKHVDIRRIQHYGAKEAWDYTLGVSKGQDPDSMQVSFTYSLALYSERDMEQFLRGFVLFLVSVIRDCHQIVGEIAADIEVEIIMGYDSLCG
ncbi:hypothetical protein NA57DRAFT_43427 [Rhizodiscina lignyota]|uniref:Polyketide synthase n=1 Tax=Rhizodiscina lignyota TaxID=1504668 RepID=A0A9P4I6X4_9PEZI|nr:hypothetical protein NA57DRAFT_43427 [Rhizodiscina lignyota]